MMARAQRPDPRRVRRGRTISMLVALALVSFSPNAAYYLGHLYGRVAPRDTPELPLAPVPDATRADIQAYATTLPEFTAALDDLRPSDRRRVTLLERHFRVYLRARGTLGRAQAASLMRLIAAEVRNQNPARARRSVFSSPEAALADVERWLAFLHDTLARPQRGTSAQLAARIRAHAPVPMAPDVVFGNRTGLLRAANALHLSPAILAAIVDNEQAGQASGYGLAGLLRTFTDTAAQRAAQTYGASGLTGRLSQTVGVAQMSWQDALGQEERLRAHGVHLARFPRTEAQVRALLNRPAPNLLLSASRLAGYLNHEVGAGPLDVRRHTDAWAFFTGPGWHNNPALASSGQTWPYAWNGFFKACLYARALP
ncbi:hypothetical protein [Deinococcus maricopensis]|uniref:Uncharacterized protein n=1 Tax=Deinococcus maricopensis (strain DSM 21211 / LMG 22137 / NRRL B-23946 / LB-34) TaxID=709986 RepID=E8U8I2_DEIML|nr:hypothetical protein [Deinococcus maricopensis]ADV67371.1 hypothetical protein Deima_1722 [Deinococcus maricopensis DSM 21211]